MNESIHQGVVHHQAGRLADAERIYRQLLAANPNNADALHLLGVLAYQVRRYDDALKLICRAIEIRPAAAMYHNNLGNVFGAMARPDLAEQQQRRAIQIDPAYVDAHVNLATSLREQAKFDDAVSIYQQATKLAPQLAETYGNLGTALKDQGRIDESLAAYRRAIELKPDYVDAHANLLYAMHASDQIDPDDIFAEHQRWGRRFADPLTAAAAPIERDRSADRRLRVGFVSPDFREHPVARFLLPILQRLDRTRFEKVCYSDVGRPDAMTGRIQANVDAWHPVAGMSDESLASVIRSHRIDVLIDLAGHTNGSRLLTFARRPAATQITFLGYPDTTGMVAMDARITDALADPAGAESRYTETLSRLPGCFLCYPLGDDLPPIECTTSDGRVRFGSFSNLAKMSPITLRRWKSVLDAVKDSTLLIKATSLGDSRTRQRAFDRLIEHGLPANRMELIGPKETQADHLSTYQRIDVALDTFPYNGTTTTCEALAMGVPVVSLVGENHASRVGLSLLTAAGFPQWAAMNATQFVQIAADLAANRQRLKEIRSSMRDRLRQSILCDAAAYAQKFQQALLEIWDRDRG